MVQLAMFYPDLRMANSLTAVAAILVNHEFISLECVLKVIIRYEWFSWRCFILI